MCYTVIKNCRNQYVPQMMGIFMSWHLRASAVNILLSYAATVLYKLQGCRGHIANGWLVILAAKFAYAMFACKLHHNFSGHC